MKKAGKIIAYSIALLIVIAIAVSIVAIYHMGYNTAHYREKDIEARPLRIDTTSNRNIKI